MNNEQKKKKKKDPYKQKKFKKALTKAIVIEIVIILFFSLAIYEQRTPTEENTYQITGKIEDYHISRSVRYRDYVFWMDGVKYNLNRFFYTSREDSSQDRIDRIMTENEVTLTVMETFSIGKWIVDIRSENQIYHDIEDEQSYRNSQRTSAIVGFIIIFVIYNVFASIPVLHWYEFPKRQYKKKNQNKENHHVQKKS